MPATPNSGLRPRRERDFAAEARASERYEVLRQLSDDELAEMAGFRGPRQQMIATIITRETT